MVEPEQPEEIEPRVVTEDVRDEISRVILPTIEDEGESVALLAERASTSTRTVYRVLGVERSTISLDLADRLLVAAGAHLLSCRLAWPNGRITGYDGTSE